MTKSETVLVTRGQGVLGITLNRPEKLNSFNEEMHIAFRAALQTAHDDPTVRAVLLTGSGRGFCAAVRIWVIVIREAVRFLISAIRSRRFITLPCD